MSIADSSRIHELQSICRALEARIEALERLVYPLGHKVPEDFSGAAPQPVLKRGPGRPPKAA